MTTTPSARRGAAREQAILDAAIDLVGEQGYERVTVDAIASRARASKTTMYRRWPGKAELVADALRRRAQGASPEVPDTGSLRGDLLASVEQIAQTLSGSPGPSLIGMLEAIRDDAVLREIVGSQVRQRSHEVAQIISARAELRGDVVHSGRSAVVLDLAFAQLFTDTLFRGGIPEHSSLERLVDDVLLPLVNGGSPTA
jgi:AcrR family transcriptional regulator